mgnify:FL=1
MRRSHLKLMVAHAVFLLGAGLAACEDLQLRSICGDGVLDVDRGEIYEVGPETCWRN